jgi:hypothetical protein
MSTFDIATIDLTPYQSTPLLPAEATLTLAVDLHANMSANAPPYVQKAAKRMLDTANEIKQVLITRVELAGANARMQMSFDNACDRFWVSVRHRLFYWMNYDHEGLDLLNEAEQDKIDLEDKQQKAELARELEKHLFGIDGLKFLGKPFNQQVALMASRLSFVAANEKFSDYEELIGADLLNTLNVLQGRYEAMVRLRSSRDDDGANVRQLRHTLQRHIAFYSTAALTAIDDEDPDSAELVLASLRPMVNARVRKGGSGEETSDSSEPASEGLPLPADLLEGEPEPADENADNE